MLDWVAVSNSLAAPSAGLDHPLADRARAVLQGTGQVAVGVNNQTDFWRPHRVGRLEVRGTPIQQGKTLQLWLVELVNADHKVVARGQVRLFNQPLALKA